MEKKEPQEIRVEIPEKFPDGEVPICFWNLFPTNSHNFVLIVGGNGAKAMLTKGGLSKGTNHFLYREFPDVESAKRFAKILKGIKDETELKYFGFLNEQGELFLKDSPEVEKKLERELLQLPVVINSFIRKFGAREVLEEIQKSLQEISKELKDGRTGMDLPNMGTSYSLIAEGLGDFILYGESVSEVDAY